MISKLESDRPPTEPPSDLNARACMESAALLAGVAVLTYALGWWVAGVFLVLMAVGSRKGRNA